MTGPHVEDVVYSAWKGGYREGWCEAWDCALDRAVTLLRNRVSADVLAELVALSASPPAATKYPDMPRGADADR